MMSRTARWTLLLDIVAEEGRVDIEDAARRLRVSAATVRRDLDELDSQQLLVRTRGGAIPHSVSYELPLRYKMSRHADEKHLIGVAAAALVNPGAVVGLNGGTTTTEVARAIALRSDLGDGNSDGSPQVTVVTNALNIAHELAVRPQVKLVLTGGVVRSQSYELVGPLAMPTLERLHLDIAFLGVDGVSALSGACTNNEGEAAINELMVAHARHVVVVADASKLGRHAFARICEIDRVDIVITGRDANPAVVAELRSAGVDVRITEPASQPVA